MKKFLKITGLTIVILLGVLIALPFLFKDKIIQKVKDEANNNLNAKVDFGQFDISIFRSFPDFSLLIDNVIVTNTGEFEGITLADIKQFAITIDIKSVIGGGTIKIKSLGLSEPKLHIKVLKNGKANYDIAKSDSTQATESHTAEESTAFSLKLNEYYINNADLIYDDASLDMYCELINLTHTGNGDFTQDLFLLKTITHADRFTFIYDNVPYFNKVRTDIKMNLDMDKPNSKFTFKENEFQLNNLFLGMDGFLAMPKEDIDMDIKFYAKQTEFKNILSLIPAVYARDFETVQTKGKLALDGFVKGIYNEKSIPGFALNLSVDDAMFKYPDLPKSVENINVKMNVSNKGGDPDYTLVDISKFHFEMAQNPVDIKLKVSTPVSDPNIDCAIKSQLNLANIKDVIPTNAGESYEGMITADITMKGKLSTLEKEKYEEFEALGTLILLDMDYKSPDIAYDMHIGKAYFNFSPKFVEMSSFESKIGKSDINANGRIDNFLAYYFRDDALKGTFNMTSGYLNLDEFMADSDTASATVSDTTATEPMSVIEVPGNIDFAMTTQIAKLHYDNMEIENVKGKLLIKDKAVNLDGLSMNMIGGELLLAGTYNTVNPQQPAVDFKMDIKQFDLPSTFKTFNTIKKLAPVIENSKGRFSTLLSFKCNLDEKMEPVMSTLAGEGKLTTHAVSIENSGTISKMADMMKQEKYKKIFLDNVNIAFKFTDGKVVVEPFDFKLHNSDVNVSGHNGFDQTMNYQLKMNVPTSEFGGAAGAMAGVLSQFNSKTGANAQTPEKVKVIVNITGTVTEPKVSVDMGDMLSSATDNLKDKAKDELNKKKEELENKAKEEVDKLKKEAEDKARQEAEKAKQEAERLKNEAEEKARQEAEKAKKEAEEKAKKEADKVKDAAKDKAKDLFGKPKK